MHFKITFISNDVIIERWLPNSCHKPTGPRRPVYRFTHSQGVPALAVLNEAPFEYLLRDIAFKAMHDL